MDKNYFCPKTFLSQHVLFPKLLSILPLNLSYLNKPFALNDQYCVLKVTPAEGDMKGGDKTTLELGEGWEGWMGHRDKAQNNIIGYSIYREYVPCSTTTQQPPTAHPPLTYNSLY